MSTTILAFGASGKSAGLLLPALAARGAHVRGFVRKDADADEVRRLGAKEVAVGDLTDRPSVERAMAGVERVFYIGPAFMPREAETGCAIVEAAAKAGVRRFVFSSVIHPVLSGLANHAAKAPVEEAILDSGMEYALLHPALFFQNYAGGWPKVAASNVLAEPWSCETRFSRVDYRDVAEAAAAALTEDRLLNGTFELCAAGEFNRHDVAALMGEALGREVRAAKTDPDAPGDEARAMRPMFDHYDRTGLVGNPLTLRAILGREPRTLRAYFDELAAEHGGES